MRSSWLEPLQAAMIATLGKPEWWAMSLAAFLVRGGLLIVLIPILSLPTLAAVVTAVSPLAASVVLGRPSIEGAVAGSVVLLGVLVGLAAAGLAGAWLDLALVRAATEDEDVDPAWRPVQPSATNALVIRLTAHLPTLLAVAYGFLRTLSVAYEEFTSPSDSGVQIADRVARREPDVVVLLVLAWLVGETVGSLAARRASAGMAAFPALAASVRQLLAPRGLATIGVTSLVLLAILLPFELAAGRAWQHLRLYLLEGVDPVQLWAALILLVATWVLGLAILGAGLAWRATAWTAQVPPPPSPSRNMHSGRP